MRRRLSLSVLLAMLAAGPAAAQSAPAAAPPAAPDPNAIDTGNFVTPPNADTQQALAHQVAQLPWIDGAAKIAIDQASITVPTGYEILTPPNGQKFLQLNGNPPSQADADDNILQNDDPASTWFAIFTYENSGHIADAQPIDSGALLATIQKLNDQNNAALRKHGQPTQTLNGWAIPPNYDKTIHRLAWAFDFTNADNSPNIVLNIRLLGRAGNLKVQVFDDPSSLVKDLPDIDKALSRAGFPQGQTYEDANSADARSPYGLVGLIGGAAPDPQRPPARHGCLIGALVAALLAIVAGFLTWRQRK